MGAGKVRWVSRNMPGLSHSFYTPKITLGQMAAIANTMVIPMAKIRFNGPLSIRMSSFLTLSAVAVQTYIRHLFQYRLEPSWDAEIEIGIRFWRQQFTKAMNQADMERGRQIFDSVQTDTDDEYPVDREWNESPSGTWFVPPSPDAATILYFHGGGYTFNGPLSDRFASLFCHRTRSRLFAADYRLTPEHPHPAQAEDALAAWEYVTRDTPPDRVVVMGDSAGGHLALMLLQTLKHRSLPQPALCVGLCPWTDIGARGASLQSNNQYDLVQGWMALRFGEWLDPVGNYGREALSPIFHDYSGLAPLYLQAGGREILHDMIVEFAKVQRANGAKILLDEWPDMPHNFQAYDSMKSSSTEALKRLGAAVDAFAGKGAEFVSGDTTTVVSDHFAPMNKQAELN